MKNEDFDISFNEKEEIDFIINTLPVEMKEKVSEEIIDSFLDLIYEYYEKLGLFDENAKDDDTVEIDEDKMVNYIVEKSSSIGTKELFSPDEIRFIVQGEMSYYDENGSYEE